MPSLIMIIGEDVDRITDFISLIEGCIGKNYEYLYGYGLSPNEVAVLEDISKIVGDIFGHRALITISSKPFSNVPGMEDHFDETPYSYHHHYYVKDPRELYDLGELSKHVRKALLEFGSRRVFYPDVPLHGMDSLLIVTDLEDDVVLSAILSLAFYIALASEGRRPVVVIRLSRGNGTIDVFNANAVVNKLEEELRKRWAYGDYKEIRDFLKDELGATWINDIGSYVLSLYPDEAKEVTIINPYYESLAKDISEAMVKFLLDVFQGNIDISKYIEGKASWHYETPLHVFDLKGRDFHVHLKHYNIVMPAAPKLLELSTKYTFPSIAVQRRERTPEELKELVSDILDILNVS